MRAHPQILVIAITFLAGCSKSTPPAPSARAEESSLPKITVQANSRMLYTFVKGGGGEFETVDAIDKVPKDRRGWVRVLDLKIKPGKRKDHELVYVADLQKTGKDGAYPYVVMSRKAFESATLNRVRQGALSPAPAVNKPGQSSARVILYSTSWCPACKTAREYLKEHGIDHVEKDIEEDSSAAAELLEKAKQAGISASGVPVLDVNGTLMQGFNAQRLHTLLGDKK